MPDSKTAWRCRVCGYVHRGPEPPERCPVCDAPREAFEVMEEGAADAPEAEKAERVVIIGAGAAGMAAAESLRGAAPETKIVLISEETERPYYRLNLTRYLAGEIGRDELFIHPTSWYDEHDMELLLGKEASRIDLDAHVVELSDGAKIPYEKVLLAAGAHPFVPPLPGADYKGVTSVRTVQDADYILDACRTGARCVCIGGGILGLETAGALARQGADVTLLERHEWLMPRQLNPKAAEILSGQVNRLGIKLLREASTQEIVGDTAVRGVRLKDGRDIPADLVVIATGVRSNSSLAQESGLNVNRGVVVDNYLRASHPDVLAAGDVAEHEGVIHGLWTVSQAQGAIAGMNLGGNATEFGGLPRFNTLKVLGLELASIGQIMPEEDRDQVFEQEADGRYCYFVFRENRLVGTVLLGDMSLLSATKDAIENKRDCAAALRGEPTAERVIDYLRSAGAETTEATGGRGVPGTARPDAAPGSPGQSGERRYRCSVCGYVYAEREERRTFSELPENWVCPVCGAAKSSFEPLDPEQPEPERSPLGRVALAHRVFGYVFLAVYVLLMWQMVPRLWAYQIEFPARTVMHMSFGMAIGVILLLKISIVRFFKRLDPLLVTSLGTSLLVGSVVLIGIAVPPAFREALATGRLFEEENRRRVDELLVQSGVDESRSGELTTVNSLRAGQRVLRQRCVNCHDLRTVLAKPRTPDNWRQTVRRMAGRMPLFNPLTDQEQWRVTAYLVALSPRLQQSARQLREQQVEQDERQQAAAKLPLGDDPESSHDPAEAKRLFQTKCSACHEATLVEYVSLESEADARDLVMRMVDQGLRAEQTELSLIVRYLTDTHVKESKP